MLDWLREISGMKERYLHTAPMHNQLYQRFMVLSYECLKHALQEFPTPEVISPNDRKG